jgi:type I restriction enzyme S subunit
MKMKPEYKKTEVGIVPKNWDIKSFGDLFDFSGGFSASHAQLSETGYCYLHYGDIHGSTKTYIDVQAHFLDIPKINIQLNKVSPRSLLKDGDIVFVDASEDDKGTSKHVIVVNKENIPFISGLHTIVAKSKTNEITNEYRHYCFQTEVIRRQFLFYAVGTKVSGISKSNIVKLLLPYPKISEQLYIAAVLRDVDELLESLDKLIIKKKNLKQSTMEQLMTGQIRLPGFSETWEVKRLGDIGEFSSAGVNKKIQQDEVPVRLVNYLDIYHKDFIFSHDLNHWVTAPIDQLSRCAVQIGDVFFTPSSETQNDIGHSAVAMENIPDAAYSYHVVRFRLHEPWDLHFRTYAFKTRAFLIQAEMLCDGSGTRYVISKGKFKRMTVKVPTVNEQTAISTVLYDMDIELASIELRRNKIQNLKQAMMQELLTGKTRLIKPEVTYA